MIYNIYSNYYYFLGARENLNKKRHNSFLSVEKYSVHVKKQSMKLYMLYFKHHILTDLRGKREPFFMGVKRKHLEYLQLGSQSCSQ